MSLKRSSVLLDVDPSLIEKNLLLKTDDTTDDLESYVRNKLENSEPDAITPWKLVKPQPGFCIKTSDVDKKKVFINLCCLDDVPYPVDISDELLTAALEYNDINEFSECRIPISIQAPRDELDKSGQGTVAYDVAINSGLFIKLQTQELLKRYLIQVIMNGVENKYDIEINKEDYTILKHRKSLGELSVHRIRSYDGDYKPPKRLIQEVRPTKSTNPHIEPPYRLLVGPGLRAPQHLIAQIYLENLVSWQDVDLQLGADHLTLTCPRSGYKLDVFLPYYVDNLSAKADFDGGTNVLTLTVAIATASTTASL